jgi:micrococcal nuclease
VTVAPEYRYRATVVDVVDGDTLTLDIDLGFSVTVRERVRLYGVDTKETKGATRAAGLATTDRVRELLPVGAQVVVDTIKNKRGADRQEKYGRYLVVVYHDPTGPSLNEYLLNEGLARVAPWK